MNPIYVKFAIVSEPGNLGPIEGQTEKRNSWIDGLTKTPTQKHPIILVISSDIRLAKGLTVILVGNENHVSQMAPCWSWTWWCSRYLLCVFLFHKSLLFRSAVGFILQYGHSFGPSRLPGSFPCRITTFWRSKDYGKSVGETQSRETVASFFGYQKTFGKKSPNLGMNLEMNLDISQTFMSNFPHLELCANFWLIFIPFAHLSHVSYYHSPILPLDLSGTQHFSDVFWSIHSQLLLAQPWFYVSRRAARGSFPTWQRTLTGRQCLGPSRKLFFFLTENFEFREF